MMAAGTAARAGARVVLLEKNDRPGRKLLLTGKGRCNLTNSRPLAEFIENYPGNGVFLFSALNVFGNQELMQFFTSRGVPLKEERGGRVFPASDRSLDILKALVGYLRAGEVELRLNEPATRLLVDWENRRVRGAATSRDKYVADAVIISTGGLSYPKTGSTGDGYRWARELGHTLITPRPALVPLETAEEWRAELAGLTLKNVSVRALADGVLLGEDFGELLFTHFGVSGPTVLTLSGFITDYWERRTAEVTLSIDLKPALDPEQLDRRLQRELAKAGRRLFKNSLGELLPRALIPVFVRISGIPGNKPANQITREERQGMIRLLQHFQLRAVRPRPLEEAIVTAGGVAVKEIDPRTMASRRWSGLYFAGEVIDVYGYTGGYNLQAAFSTGYLAGRSAARE